MVEQTGWRWMVRSLLSLIIGLMVSLGSLGMSVPMAIAAPSPPPDIETIPESPSAASVQVDDISAEKVSQFVNAYLRVLDLLERREGDLQAAETQLESARLAEEIEAEAVSIIDEEGLTVKEYFQLLGLANTDPDFGDRVATQLQEATS